MHFYSLLSLTGTRFESLLYLSSGLWMRQIRPVGERVSEEMIPIEVGRISQEKVGHMAKMTWRAGLLAAALMAGGVAAIAQTASNPEVPATTMPAGMPDILQGYLPRGAVPNSLDVLPPAPTRNSATQKRDVASAAAARKLKGSARWDVARQDADLSFPNAADDYSCALGVKVSKETTPHLYTLLRRTLTDAGLSTYPTKNQYMRARPFTVTGGPICTPDQADMLRKDGSYPSGHSAIGWTWALILAEAAPDRADAILARGRAFMESRVVCNVHWLSDTEAGAMMGSTVAARLHDEPAFRADLEAARAEIASARAAGAKPTRDCSAEAAALASAPFKLP